jgi:low molecular weight protein-tyrosine phosphatase
MRSVLFVCTANICRSPTAEGVLRRMLEQQGIAGQLEIDSAGTHDYHVGAPPFPAAVEIAKRRGYDIKHLIARRVAPGDFDHFDMILAMDRLNIAGLRTIAPTRSKQKIELLLEYGDKFHGGEIPDPYNGPEKGFELALDMIEDGCMGLMELLKRTVRR